MDMQVISIGRSSVNDIHMSDQDDTISRRHAELVVGPSGDMLLTDCNSTCGTYVLINGQWEAVKQHVVRHSDELRLGKNTVLTVSDILRMRR